ncbi:MAG: DUF2281 domain-containing protein [Chloroflexi bacterium]|nr:DUF2281 domain-containing protein [Chloroflexota bacterium]
MSEEHLTEIQAGQIIQILQELPPDKVAEVYDFVLFLQTRYSQTQPVDTNDAWSDEDMADLALASLHYAGEAEQSEDGGNG